MQRHQAVAIIIGWLLSALLAAQGPEVRREFRVKYVAEGALYLDGGRSAGLAEGMKLVLKRPGMAADQPPVELQITSVAETSAVCEVKGAPAEIRVGDVVELLAQDAGAVRATRSAAEAKKYAQVVTFTEGDPLDEEQRAAVPRPPLPEVNRARGRIGLEYSTILDRSGAGLRSSQTGLVFRGDMTRIGGSYWSLSGYWRGRLNSRVAGPQHETLTDLLNRTYHLTLSYNNPQSAWTMGFGRFYLPWAASLETIDGGYLGRRVSKGTTVGMFAGSSPDPTSWNYNPDRQLLGTFANHEAGSFDNVRYTTTGGVAVSRIRWRPERQFAFFENAIFYKQYVSVYHNLEADKLSRVRDGRDGATVSRSFLTFRVQPARMLSLDLNHNYFRTTPTFDPRLVGAGLVDRLLFQGISGGVRLDLPIRVSLYSNVGRSDREGDARRSWNQMYGVALVRIWGIGARADARYSRFDSSYGRGTYRSLLFSREVGETLRFDIQAGRQDFVSTLTSQNRAHFVNGNVDWFLTRRYFLGGGLTAYRGRVQSYDQVYVNLGYRF